MKGEDVTGLGLAFGSSAEGRAWIGKVSPTRTADALVSESMIRTYCSLVEDGNARYWEAGESPPGLLMSYGFPLGWKPDQPRRPGLFAMAVPLPGHHIINVTTDTEFHLAPRVGDVVNSVDEILDVSEQKRTRLGNGHFITSRTTYTRQDGALLAVNLNVLFRYDTDQQT